MKVLKRFFLLLMIIMLMLCGCKSATDDKAEGLYENAAQNEVSLLENKVIVIDPGHGLNQNPDKEPIAPGSEILKPANVSGTQGKYQTEEQLVLSVAKMLREKLQTLGADVYMTRYTHKAYLTNIERAEMANDLSADICVRVHADGSEDKEKHGVSVLIPQGELLTKPNICEKSEYLAERVLDHVVKETGAKNNGLVGREDLTGFNWSEVPVILLEIGYMTNAEEDERLSKQEYQNKIADGTVKGILQYYSEVKD